MTSTYFTFWTTMIITQFLDYQKGSHINNFFRTRRESRTTFADQENEFVVLARLFSYHRYVSETTCKINFSEILNPAGMLSILLQ